MFGTVQTGVQLFLNAINKHILMFFHTTNTFLFKSGCNGVNNSM